MPDNPPAKKSTFGFLAKKIGPVPVWVIIAAAVAIWYWYFHYGPGAKAKAATAANQALGNAAQTGEVINVHIVDEDERRTGTGRDKDDDDDKRRRRRGRPRPVTDTGHHPGQDAPAAEPAGQNGGNEDMTTRWRATA